MPATQDRCDAGAHPDDPGGGATTVVSRAEDARYAAMTAGDLEALSAVLSDLLIYTHTTGDTDTKHSYLRAVADGVVRYRSVVRCDERFAVHDGCVLSRGRQLGMTVFRGEPRPVDSAYLAVWVPGGLYGWSLAGWHATRHTPTR